MAKRGIAPTKMLQGDDCYLSTPSQQIRMCESLLNSQGLERHFAVSKKIDYLMQIIHDPLFRLLSHHRLAVTYSTPWVLKFLIG